MFAKRLFQKAANRHLHHHDKGQGQGQGQLSPDDFNFRINVHYGIPSTASILAFDHIQRLLAIATLDGRIKIIGGDNIEGLLISPKLSPYKYLEFLQNQGLLISITNNNDIQIWDLRRRSIACSLKWESNVTAFSVISGSTFMCVGNEYGFMSVLKYDADNGQLFQLPYNLSPDSLTARFSTLNGQTVVGVLPQPCSSGKRLLIAYESGLIILWDVAEADIVAIRGDKVLQLENEAILNDANNKTVDDSPPAHEIEDKEISALCWASLDGSILAVGYIDGDILFWNLKNKSSSKDQKAGLLQHVVKLQLSSADKRLPVIVLHWLGNGKCRNHGDGKLLVYGGDEIGCEEVITILSLEWSSGKEAVKCLGRVDLTLNGSFADMILLPSAGATWNDGNTSLFVLTNPGRITIYNIASLSSSESPVSAINFPACIPATDPLMTVSKIFNTCGSMNGVSKVTATNSTPILLENIKWPLTGGVNNHLSFGQDNKVHRVYVAGYQDGSVRIWDATYPVFSLLCILSTEDTVKNLADSCCAVTTISLCSMTLRLAVGSDCGLVQLYNLSSSEETTFHFVTETESEVRSSTQVQGPQCRAIFNLQKSRVQALEFTTNGTKLIVGYECSRIAVLDVHSSSVLFITDSSTMLNSSLMSVVWKDFIHDSMRSPHESSPKILDNSRREFIFVLSKDSSIHIIDGNNGSMISSRATKLKKKSSSVSLYAIKSHAAVSKSVNEKHSANDDNITHEVSPNGNKRCETDDHFSDRNTSMQSLKEFSVVLCCEDSIRVYPAMSVVQGESKSTYKVKLSKLCCWTTVLVKAEYACGLVLLYQTGEMEVRSLPDLQVLKEYSLMADLRWNFKVNMERMIDSTDNDNMALANGCEVAFVSILNGESQFRIPDSLPTLHDEVLAAAATAAISANSDLKRKQGINPGIIGGIVRGLKGQKPNKLKLESGSESNFIHLEDIFMKNPFLMQTTPNGKEDDELNIDDIEIDEPEPSKASTSFQELDNKDRDKRNDREKLLDSGGEMKPRLRTRDEIIAKYRKAGDASSAAGEARNKLLERQEKLEKISRRTEDMRNGAEDFASLANELVKAMENRKWYHI